MTLEQAYFVSQITAAIFVVASILFLAISVRQNSKMLQRTMNEDYRNTLNNLWDDVSRSRDFAEFHMRIGSDYQSLDKIDQYRARFVAQKNIANIMHSVQARLAGHVSEEEWRAVQQSIRMAATRENVIDAWKRFKIFYPENAQRLWDQESQAPHSILS